MVFFSKCDQIRRKLKNLMENFISCAMRLIKKLSSKYIKIVSYTKEISGTSKMMGLKWNYKKNLVFLTTWDNFKEVSKFLSQVGHSVFLLILAVKIYPE